MNLIVAVDNNWGIGKDGGLLCHLSGDLKYFKETTMGHPVIMGRKTLESLPGGKGLPGRRNIVLTGKTDYSAEGVEMVHSIPELRKVLKDIQAGDGAEPFVIGGAAVYDELLPFCDTLYVTKIDETFQADRFFEDLDENDSFRLVWESEEQEENGIKFRFTKYERIPEDEHQTGDGQ